MLLNADNATILCSTTRIVTRKLIKSLICSWSNLMLKIECWTSWDKRITSLVWVNKLTCSEPILCGNAGGVSRLGLQRLRDTGESKGILGFSRRLHEPIILPSEELQIKKALKGHSFSPSIFLIIPYMYCMSYFNLIKLFLLCNVCRSFNSGHDTLD